MFQARKDSNDDAPAADEEDFITDGKFRVSRLDARRVSSVLTTFVNDDSEYYAKLRTAVRKESIPPSGKTRTTSQSNLKYLHAEFPSIRGCSTDASCTKKLFKAAIDDDNAREIMLAVNGILPLMLTNQFLLHRLK